MRAAASTFVRSRWNSEGPLGFPGAFVLGERRWLPVDVEHGQGDGAPLDVEGPVLELRRGPDAERLGQGANREAGDPAQEYGRGNSRKWLGDPLGGGTGVAESGACVGGAHPRESSAAI